LLRNYYFYSLDVKKHCFGCKKIFFIIFAQIFKILFNMKKVIIIIGLFCITYAMQAQDIKLNEPVRKGGQPVMEAFAARHSERSYVKKEMPVQMLSDLLWVAYGFNREDKRTVPTASNRQELEVYVMFETGVYFYDAKANILKLINEGNFLSALGQENITQNAAVNIIVVGDLNKSSRDAANFATGCVSQNIYLFAETYGLGTVARGSYKRDELSKVLKLDEKKEITIVQPVGFLK
jgi:SagB-type dehydrogenase family enzyme